MLNNTQSQTWKNDTLNHCMSLFPSLRDLETHDLIKLERTVEYKSLNIDQIAYEPGWKCQYFFMCLEGKTRVFKRSESGREILLYHVKQGETCVLTTSCLLSGQHFPANSIAEQETQLAAIPAQTFNELLSSSEIFRQFVLNNYGHMLSSLITLVDQVAFDRIDQRLAKHLLALADKDGVILRTHQALALDLASVREVISRQLQDWESRGVLVTKRGRVEIINSDFLANITSL